MKTITINGAQVTFDTVTEFVQADTEKLACFFFKDGDLITSEFLTVEEFNKIKD